MPLLDLAPRDNARVVLFCRTIAASLSGLTLARGCNEGIAILKTPSAFSQSDRALESKLQVLLLDLAPGDNARVVLFCRTIAASLS